MHRWNPLALALTAALGLTAACSRPPPKARTGDLTGTWENTPRGEQDVVIATVDGRRIYASDLAAQVRTTGQDIDTALQALIDFEVLAGRARAVGLTMSQETRRVLREYTVQSFLAKDFEATHRLADMPEQELRSLYDKVKDRFVHPRAVKVEFLVFAPAEGYAEAAARADAAALASHLKKTLAGVATTDRIGVFRATSESEPWKGKGVRLRSVAVDSNETEWGAALLQLREVGETTPILRNEAGFFTAILVEEFPERSDTYEKIHDQIAALYYDTWRTKAFKELTDSLVARSGARILEEKVKALFAAR